MPEKPPVPPSKTPEEEKFAFTRDVNAVEWPEKWDSTAFKMCNELLDRIGWPQDDRRFETDPEFERQLLERYRRASLLDAQNVKNAEDLIVASFNMLRGLADRVRRGVPPPHTPPRVLGEKLEDLVKRFEIP